MHLKHKEKPAETDNKQPCVTSFLVPLAYVIVMILSGENSPGNNNNGDGDVLLLSFVKAEGFTELMAVV